MLQNEHFTPKNRPRYSRERALQGLVIQKRLMFFQKHYYYSLDRAQAIHPESQLAVVLSPLYLENTKMGRGKDGYAPLRGVAHT